MSLEECESQDDHWHIAEAQSPLLISTGKDLQNASDIVSKALVVGLDCEWPPRETGNRPSSTVLQLACWEPSQGLVVLVLDLLALDVTETSKILQSLFSDTNILKVGYSFKSDVFALDMTLRSSEIGASVAIIEPIIDIASLHSHLYQRLRCLGVHSCGEGGGLSAVVNANLGRPLEKSQQCSDWGARPLSAEQLRYAATDAACLVALLSYFMHCWYQEQEKLDKNIEELPDEDRNISSIKFCPAKLDVAAKDWGERWELTGQGRKKIQITGGLSQYDTADNPLSPPFKGKKMKNKMSAMLDFPAFPRTVPWMDPKREITSSPLFLADVMLQGLARQLRLWGFNAEAVECVSKSERHIVHRQLVERAEIEGRTILTRDAIFMRRNLSDQAYFVKTENKKEQLEEIVEVFQLPVMQTALLSRCARCNGEFGETPVPANQLTAEEHGIPVGVLERVNEFWVCSGCKKAYWQGSIYARAMERLGEALQSLTVGGGGGGGEDVNVEPQVYS